MKELTVSLTGGLGNQLFQYAALLNLGKNRTKLLTKDFGKPRESSDGEPEICLFKLEASFVKYKKTFISEKIAGYLLRLGVHRKPWEIPNLMRLIATIAGSLYLTLINRRWIGIKGYTSLGYDETFKLSSYTNLLVGYFQNENLPNDENVKTKLKALRLLEEKTSVTELKEISKLEKPLVVHLRLGDYRKEDDFGIIPDSYYQNAISRIWAMDDFEKIWLFSDEPEFALDQLKRCTEKQIRVISGFTPAESVELMRMGHGYVIANSTFSWWGAFLSYRENAKVIAPKKWFKNMEDPKNLLPRRWLREKSW